jgi:hypothetical protein
LKGIKMEPTPRVATTDFHRQWTSIAPFGDPDWTMTWVPKRVVIENSSGEVIAERENPRDAFAGHLNDTPWDPLHLAYFKGMRCGHITPSRSSWLSPVTRLLKSRRLFNTV